MSFSPEERGVARIQRQRSSRGGLKAADSYTTETESANCETIQFKEHRNVVLHSTKRGRGTNRILLRQQSLGSLDISNLRRRRRVLELSKQLCPSRNKPKCLSLQKKGAWHGPRDSRLHALLSKLAIHDRNRVLQAVKKLLTGISEASNKGICGAGETPLLKLHYQIRLSSYTAVCDDQPHPRSSVTDWRVRITS